MGEEREREVLLLLLVRSRGGRSCAADEREFFLLAWVSGDGERCSVC